LGSGSFVINIYTLLKILTKHKDDGKEGVPVEGQGTQQKHADAQQPACIHKQAPRNQTQESHIKLPTFSIFQTTPQR